MGDSMGESVGESMGESIQSQQGVVAVQANKECKYRVSSDASTE